MSKGLEALKYLRECIGDRYYKNELDIIEKELKRLDMYENVVGIERIQDTNKKLKALEIIKKHIDLEDYDTAICLVERKLTQKEYDLLKEALL